MDPYIPLARASISEAEIAAVVAALRAGWLTRGPEVERFEADFAAYVGARQALAVSSCTAALHLAVLCAGVHAGDEVILPTLTFVSTANVVVQAGATPVFADVDPETLTLDAESARKKLSPRTRAVIAVHYAGQPCDLEALEALAALHRLALIEDAAHAVGAEYRGRRVGGLGHPACFSFYPIKNMTTGEGGMLTGLAGEAMARARRLSLHGLDNAAWNRYERRGNVFYEMAEAGFKYNMTDPEAALGRVQLARLPDFLARRAQLAARYARNLGGHPRIRIPAVRDDVRHAWHLFPVVLDFSGLALCRDELIVKLKERGIGTSVHFIPVHLQPFYRQRYGTRPGDCPVAEGLFPRLLSLPMFSELSDAEVDRVSAALLELLG